MRTRLAVLLSLALPVMVSACSEEKPAPPPAPYAVEEVPLSQISEDLAAGKTTSVEITKGYIHRMETILDETSTQRHHPDRARRP